MKSVLVFLEQLIFFKDIIPKFLEITVMSGCPHCSAIRAILFGFGLATIQSYGMYIIVPVVILTFLSRRFIDADSS